MPATIAPITTHWYGQCAHDTLARYFFLSHHSPIRCRLFFLQQSIDFSVRILQIDLYAVLLTSDYYFCWYFLLMRCVYLTLYNIGNGAVQLIRIEMHWKLSLTNELNCKPKSNNLRYLGVKIGCCVSFKWCLSFKISSNEKRSGSIWIGEKGTESNKWTRIKA